MILDLGFMWTALLNIAHYIPVTLELTFGALLIALPLSILFAFVTDKSVPVISQISRVLISLIRGTPIILHMYVLYNLLPSILNIILVRMGSTVKIWQVNNIYYAFMALALFPVTSLTEAFRSSLSVVDKGQLEAASTVGMTKFQGYMHIVIPQAIVTAIPLMCNTVVDLIKSTSLAFTMMVVEITGEAKTLGGLHLSYIEAYLDILIIYVILVVILEKFFKIMEKRLSVFKVL